MTDLGVPEGNVAGGLVDEAIFGPVAVPVLSSDERLHHGRHRGGMRVV